MSLYKYKNIYIYNIKMLNIKYIIFLIFIGVVYYIYTFIKKIHTKIINLDDIINHDDDIKAIKNLINAKSLTNMIFYGPPGTGKTSLILAIARYIYGDINYKNYIKIT